VRREEKDFEVVKKLMLLLNTSLYENAIENRGAAHIAQALWGNTALKHLK
jgi:hypothetical protein